MWEFSRGQIELLTTVYVPGNCKKAQSTRCLVFKLNSSEQLSEVMADTDPLVKGINFLSHPHYRPSGQ